MTPLRTVLAVGGLLAATSLLVQMPVASAQVVENDVEYVGNTLVSYTGAAVSCCEECSYTKGCAAYTWTNHDGGTCYLKTGKGETAPLAGAVSGVCVQPTPSPTTTAPAPTPAPTPTSTLPPNDISCSIRTNQDFVGNDIASVAGNTSRSCCSACKCTTGCQAFSWSTYNGGTCFLKSAMGNVVATPGVESAFVENFGCDVKPTPAPTPTPTPPVSDDITCSIRLNRDIVGNDIGAYAGSTSRACCSICKSTGGCNAFSWSSYNGGTCFLKSKMGQVVETPGVESAFVENGYSCSLENDVDFIGNDIANVQRPRADDCCGVCWATSDCGAFSWSSYNGGTCWLKSGKGASGYSFGVTSGVVKTPKSCNMQLDTDYTGPDIGNVQKANAEDCCDACRSFAGCKAFSWSNHNGGTCWLKSAKGNTKYNVGVKSAAVN